jgi:hypothetical protein
LLGEQMRPHDDLDIVVEERHLLGLRATLQEDGFKDVERDDTSAWNFVLGHDDGRQVDVHAIVFEAAGNGIYGPAENGLPISGRLAVGRRQRGGRGSEMPDGRVSGRVGPRPHLAQQGPPGRQCPAPALRPASADLIAAR